jgi:hypothetical protein
LTFPRESYFIPGFQRKYGDPQTERQARELAARVLKLPSIKQWGLDLSPKEFSDCRTFRQLVCRLFEAWARYENKPRWGDKTPDYVLEIPALFRLFPEAKFIHLLRDGRDVALSSLEACGDSGNVYTAALKWRDWVSAGLRAGAALPLGSCLEVKYESLLTDVRSTMEKVCEFLDEPFHEAVLAPTAFGRSSRGASLPGRASLNRWTAAMSRDQRILFESVAGNVLKKLDYYTEEHTRWVTLPERLYWRLQHGVRSWRRRSSGVVATEMAALETRCDSLVTRLEKLVRSCQLLLGFLQFRRR